jgi:hypothetical protein
LSRLHLDSSYDRADDVPPRKPLSCFQPAFYLLGEFLKLSDHLLQFTAQRLFFGPCFDLLGEFSSSLLEPLDAGLELTFLDQTLGITINEPSDAAAYFLTLSLQLGQDVGAGIGMRVFQTALILVGEARRMFEQRTDFCPNRLIQALSPHHRIAANGQAGTARPIAAVAAIVEVFFSPVCLGPGRAAMKAVAALSADNQPLQQIPVPDPAFPDTLPVFGQLFVHRRKQLGGDNGRHRYENPLFSRHRQDGAGALGTTGMSSDRP